MLVSLKPQQTDKEINMATKLNLESKALPIVLLTVFIDVLGIGILIPVLPQLIFEIFIPAGYSMNGSLILLLDAVYCYANFRTAIR